MRLSHLFGKTLRQTPAEAETASHRLLLKAGMIYQVAAGVYSYLPLGWRAIRKIEQVIREEMDAVGGQELMLPVLQPLELWQETGRDRLLGQTLFRLKDRRDRTLCLGPTHEEVITDIARHHLRSHRDLPLMVYQIQTKFRDEPRPRGGLVRAREFTMKDLYSFDADDAAATKSYKKMLGAYERIFARCGLRAVCVEADSGAIGGKESHEFMVLADSGENEVVRCPHCGYSANVERAEFFRDPPEATGYLPREEVHTPGVKTIEGLADFLRIPKKKTLKAVFYSADGQPVMAAIRGDLEVNETKLKNALDAAELRLMGDDEVREAGLVPGSASPVGLPSNIKVVVDESAAGAHNLVAGANRPDYHLRNVNYERDFKGLAKDIALARAGYGCPKCNEPLESVRGIEVGHTFKLGTVYSEKLGAWFLDEKGQQRPLVMGCYGIGSGRLLAAAVEQHHDDKGIIWPPAIAPYQVHLCVLDGGSEEIRETAERLYSELGEDGVEVLYDDRDESPGVKFNDADLLGMPLRLTVGPRAHSSGKVEIRRRDGAHQEEVELIRATERARALLDLSSAKPRSP